MDVILECGDIGRMLFWNVGKWEGSYFGMRGYWKDVILECGDIGRSVRRGYW